MAPTALAAPRTLKEWRRLQALDLQPDGVPAAARQPRAPRRRACPGPRAEFSRRAGADVGDRRSSHLAAARIVGKRCGKRRTRHHLGRAASLAASMVEICTCGRSRRCASRASRDPTRGRAAWPVAACVRRSGRERRAAGRRSRTSRRMASGDRANTSSTPSCFGDRPDLRREEQVVNGGE